MKCFILKTQDDLPNELDERRPCSAAPRRWASCLSAGEASPHRSRAAFAVFYTVCGLEMNVDVLWALTFLGQCGVCGLDLALTWGGTGRSGHGPIGGQGRGAAPSRKNHV